MGRIDLLYDFTRFAAAAPFSLAYRGRLRWLLETRQWEARGVAAVDIRRKALVVPETGAVFIAVSKVANTSLSYILSTKPGVKANNVHKKRFAPQRLVDTGRSLSDLAKGSTPIFTFVRHPIDRFWSALANQGGRLKRAVHAGAKQPPSGPVDPMDVIRYLRDTPVPLIDEHVRPQFSCTGAECLPMAFVGKLETIGADMKELVARGYLTSEQAQRLPRFNAAEHRPPSNKGEIDEALRKIYRKDMELFDYD